MKQILIVRGMKGMFLRGLIYHDGRRVILDIFSLVTVRLEYNVKAYIII